jgi:PAS domain S-box-containing protein
MPNGALMILDGVIQHANERAGEILGQSSGSLIGLEVHDALHGARSCPGGCDVEGVLADPPEVPSFLYGNFVTAGGELRRVRWTVHEFSANSTLIVFEEAYERSLIEADRTRLLETQEIARLGSWDWYTDSNRVVWTPELFSIFGVERADFAGDYESYLSRVHPTDRERVAKVIEDAFNDHEPFFFDNRVERPDGKLIFVSCSGRVFTDHTGRVVRMSGTCQDVTDRKLREQALMDREAELRLIVDQMPVIIWTMDKELRNTSVMGAALDKLEMKPEDFKGKHLYESNGDDPSHVANAAHLRALEGESTVYSADRMGRSFRTRVDPLRDDEGEVIGVLGVAIDVSDEIRAEKELQEAHENYRSLIEAIPAVSYIDSIRGKVKSLFVSPQIKDIFGFVPEDVDSTLWIRQLHPDDRHVIEMKSAAYRRGESFEEEYRILSKDGRTVWVRDQAVFVRDEEGTAIFAQGIMYDITERKRLEDQLVQSHKMDAIGRLTGGIAHDFNNLLTAILGNCYLALEDADDPAALRRAIEEVKETAELGADVVKQLLGFSRRRPIVEADAMDLRDLVASTKSLLQRVIGEDIVLQTKISEGPLLVRAHSAQITQVILNLAVNAREAMPAGGRMQIEVLHSSELRELDPRVESDPGVPVGPHAVLRVSDSGTGMDETTRASLFDPFFTTKERGPRSGTGLGLSIVYGIVTRANGFLTVDSKPGEGSRISIYLPLEPEPLELVTKAVVPIEGSGTGTVLVVEDDDRVRAIAGQMLRRMGYEVIEASDAEKAIELVVDEHIDVLLTDVVMPGMGGGRLAERLVAERPDLRVIFMSGYQEALWESGSPPAGAAFIQKPFRREDLVEKLRFEQPDVITLPQVSA